MCCILNNESKGQRNTLSLPLTYLFMDQIVHKHMYIHPQTNIYEYLNYVLSIEQ